MALSSFSQKDIKLHKQWNTVLSPASYLNTLLIILLARRYQISWVLPYHFHTLPFKCLVFMFVVFSSFWRSLFSIEPLWLSCWIKRDGARFWRRQRKVRARVCPVKEETRAAGWLSTSTPSPRKIRSPSMHEGSRAGLSRCSSFPSCWKDKLT